ncbi:hypothetical protein CEP53_003792 [Fusarium sp. AF-6]|nr:hypothetical protein CEP53_003792 [Fusarium sp. AF-6]
MTTKIEAVSTEEAPSPFPNSHKLAAGSSLHNVVKVNIYITDMQNFGLINEAYDEFFTWSPKPARTCVAVHQLPLGTDVEMECTAFLNEGQ